MNAHDAVEIGIIVVFSSAVSEAIHRFQTKRIRKNFLLGLLKDPEYTWRTLKRLRTAVALDAEKTKELLLEIGARPQAAPKNKPEDDIFWTLKKETAQAKPHPFDLAKS